MRRSWRIGMIGWSFGVAFLVSWPRARGEGAAAPAAAPATAARPAIPWPRPPRRADRSVRRAAIPPPVPAEAQVRRANPAGPAVAFDPLVPGQVIEPIDLLSALRLAGANDLDIAIARERIGQSLAELEQAQALMIPSLFVGPNWIRHDGQAQIVQGQVQSISKSSLFVGGTAAGGSSITGPLPAGGPAPVSGLVSILRISDAIYQPLAARQVVAARQARHQATTHDALLNVAEAYLDLQLAAGRVSFAREAASNATALAEITGAYSRAGAGLEADHHRVLAERDRQRRNVQAAVGQLEVASAEIVRRLHLDPHLLVAPLEPPDSILRLFPNEVPLDDLIGQALQRRPELAEGQALVQATLIRLKEAKLRPLIPSLAFRYSGGGFGGGVNAFFGNFGARSDVDVNLFWESQHLGFGDRAIRHGREAERRIAVLELLKTQDQIASEVVAAEKTRIAATRQVEEARRALDEARQSLRQNEARIGRGAGLPLEALQPIQALAQARGDYLDSVLAFNRAQFRLKRAIGLCL